MEYKATCHNHFQWKSKNKDRKAYIKWNVEKTLHVFSASDGGALVSYKNKSVVVFFFFSDYTGKGT